MRIGFSGRIGVGIMLFAAVADGASWLVRAIDNYPFDFYRQIDAYLPVVFLFGLALFLPSISIALQTKRAANLAKVSLTTVGPLPAELRLETGQAESQPTTAHTSPAHEGEIPALRLAFIPSSSRRRLFMRVAYACLVAAVILYGGVQYWVATRTNVLLNVAIPLVPGHNRTPEFRTNLRAVYWARLTLSKYGGPNCGISYGSKPAIRWQLLRSGRPVAEGVFSDSIWHWNVVVAEFEAPKGLYSMDIEPPAACMVDAPEYPRLNVEVDWQATGLDNKADLLFYILAALGITLLLWPDVRETEGLSLQGETRATYRGMARVGRCLQPLIAFTKPLSSLRMFSYMAVTGIALIYWFWAVATPLTPRGLMVYVPKPGTYLLADEPWNQPLVVRVDALGNLYLNRHPVLFADLGARLEKALSLRADWAVFVDADPDVNAGAVIAVVDLVHGIGGTKVLLVTPSMKKEKPQLAAIRPCGAQPLQTGMLKPMPKWNQDASKVLSHYPIVSFTVGERGEVSNIKLRRSSGIREIDEWVVDSMRKWRYKPTPGCDEIESKVEFSIHFY